jgi:hypothetical protein
VAQGTKTVKARLGFHTGLHAIDYADYPAFPHRGAGWHIDLLPNDPKEFPNASIRGDKIYPARELAVFARNEDAAQRAADLMHSARLLLGGSNVMSHLWPGEHPVIWPLNQIDEDKAHDDLASRKTELTTVHLPLASLIAAKASRKMGYVYAMAKLRVSLEISSVPAMHLDPSRNDNFPKSVLPEDHVRLAHALIAAWSCVEELGFEVRASSERPSRLPDGTWNPPVKANLESRLRRGGIDLAESFPWNLRGPRTRIERKRPPEIFTRAEWARWNVRDGEMMVIDAINYASFLRSSIAAHKTDPKMIRVLSIYDVANVQFLARRLILETMGLWRFKRKAVASHKRRSVSNSSQNRREVRLENPASKTPSGA